MRRVVTGVAVVLLLTACDTPANRGKSADPSGGASKSPSVTQSTARAGKTDLGAICDALKEAVKLPTNGTVRYTAKFNKPTGWATNAPICDIEPEGEYYDVAVKAPVFGRAKFNYGILTDAERQQSKYPMYTPETAQQLLTLDQADPVGDSLPCAHEPCKNGIRGYQYNFRFATTLDDIAVNAQFDYITTDVGGDKKPQYRDEAIKAFTASMDIITARL